MLGHFSLICFIVPDKIDLYNYRYFNPHCISKYQTQVIDGNIVGSMNLNTTSCLKYDKEWKKEHIIPEYDEKVNRIFSLKASIFLVVILLFNM